MKNYILLITMCLLVFSCNDAEKDEQAFFLKGAWLLKHLEYPAGAEQDYTREGNGTLCHIFTTDSVLYECKLTATPTGLVINPRAISKITLIDKGNGEQLYLEGDDPHPLTIVNDTTIIIQRSGVKFTSIKADDIFEEWGETICQTIETDLEDNKSGNSRYVLSARERQQERTIMLFACFSTLIFIIALLLVRLIFVNRREKRQLQLQLQQIQEVQENRPSAVKQAVENVEKSFFASDEYASLCRRITSGQRLKDDDWLQVEQMLKTVYPGFCSQLRGLHTMSSLEFQTCLLIKLRIAPKDIANVLTRDMSTISTVRSRLYKKVFDKKGGAKEWDDFIMSIGT